MDKDHKKLVEGLIKAQGESLAIHDEVWEEYPVSAEVFFRDFIREPCYPKQQDFVDHILGTDSKSWHEECSEAIALAGKGAGKDRTISKILTYCVYKLLCLRNPQQFLGLNDTDPNGPGSAIDLGNVSLNARLARDVFFKNFVTMVKITKNPKTGKNWFEEHGLDLGRDILSKEIKFPKDITAYSLDSIEHTGEGLNLLVVIFDEVGGFDPKKADSLYKALLTTQKTRFAKMRKTLLLSYKRDDNDFMMIRYNQAKDEEGTYRVRVSTWDWNPKRCKEDFKEDYFRDPEGSKRIFECLGSTSEEGYFKYKKRIRDCINKNRVNPIVGDIWWTDNPLGLKFKKFFVPIRGVKYFVHVDLSKGKASGDYCGFALGHVVKDRPVVLSEEYIESIVQAEGFEISKRLTEQKQPAAVIDLVLQIRARSGQEIMFDEIRQFIQSLHRAGFVIGGVSYDGWQSTDSIQILNKAGIPAEVQSVDRNTEAYDTLKEQTYKGLLDIYEHRVYIRECEELIRTNSNKVDHPDFSYKRSTDEGRMEGSKDVSDAVAGCVNSCIKNAKVSFSFGTAGLSRSTQTRPEDIYKDQLVRYGERPQPR